MIIVWKENGLVAVHYPEQKEKIELDMGVEMTQEEYLDHLIARSGKPEDEPFYYVDELPDDRYFRTAWDIVDGVVQVDMNKARSIHMDTIRQARNAELARLDVEWMRFADKRADIDATKDVLRNLPHTFNLKRAKAPAELKVMWPNELREYNEQSRN